MVAPDTSAALHDRLRLPDDPAAWDRFTTLYTPLLQACEGVVVRGRPVADVAAGLELTANVVYLARHRVLTRLRREIEPFLE